MSSLVLGSAAALDLAFFGGMLMLDERRNEDGYGTVRYNAYDLFLLGVFSRTGGAVD